MTPAQQPEELLEILADPKSRAIIAAVVNEQLSVAEIADHCDLPLSTTYRKVDTLVEKDVIDDGLRVNESGSHEHEYSLRMRSVSTGFRVDDAVEIEVSFDAMEREDDRVLRVRAPGYLG